MTFLEIALPDGPAYKIAPNGDLSKIIETLESESLLPSIERATDCGTVRDPYRCKDYNSLAVDVGIDVWDGAQDIVEYRKYLASFVYKTPRTGSDDNLQKVLDDAGFSAAVVIKNNKLQDPRQFLNFEPVMVVGGEEAFIGGEDDYIGDRGEYNYLVNGHIVDGDGYTIGYDAGDDPDYWGYIDFIGGGVTYNIDGYITSITPLEVLNSEKERFENLILRTKPMHCWIAMLVKYVEAGVIVQTGFELPVIAQTGDPEDAVIAQTGG